MTDFALSNPVAIPMFVTSPFNAARDYGNHLHEGIDLMAVDSRGEPVCVLAAATGVVVDVGRLTTGYGNYVRMRHDFEGQVYYTWYGHLSQIVVKKGQILPVGCKLGLAGETGNADGIHLHMTLQWIGHGLSGYVVADVVDPYSYLFGQTVVVTPPVQANEPLRVGDWAEVKADVLNIRLTAGGADVGDLPAGAQVKVIEQSGDWLGVRLYVHKDWVKKAAK